MAQQPYDPGPFTDVDALWGRRLWDYLNRPEIKKDMRRASDRGRPAAEPIGQGLITTFGPQVCQHRVKQFTGRLIRQAMEHQGYQHHQAGVRTPNNPCFTRASLYRRRPTS